MEGTTTVVNTGAPTAPVTQAPTETAPPQTPPRDAKQEENAARFAAIARRERAVRQQSQQFKQLQQDFARRNADFERQKQEWETEFKDKPLEAIKKRGRTYEDLTQAALNDGKFKPEVAINDVKSELQKFRDEQAKKEEDQKLRNQQNYQAQVKEAEDNFKHTLRNHAASNADRYELTNRYDPSGEMAYSVVEESWNRQEKLFRAGQGPQPKILSKEEALDLVESYYESEVEKELAELPKTKRFQQKWASKFGAQPADGKPRTSSPTLSNGLNSGASPILTSPAVDNDRMARAMARLDKNTG